MPAPDARWPPGLREDGDARSERVPTYAESACQVRMNVFGYDFQGSGCYRDETRTAVWALQHVNGITASGLLGGGVEGQVV